MRVESTKWESKIVPFLERQVASSNNNEELWCNSNRKLESIQIKTHGIFRHRAGAYYDDSSTTTAILIFNSIGFLDLTSPIQIEALTVGISSQLPIYEYRSVTQTVSSVAIDPYAANQNAKRKLEELQKKAADDPVHYTLKKQNRGSFKDYFLVQEVICELVPTPEYLTRTYRAAVQTVEENKKKAQAYLKRPF